MLRWLTLAGTLLLLAVSMTFGTTSAIAATPTPFAVPFSRTGTVTKTTLPGVIFVTRLRVREGASIRTKTMFTLLRNTHVTVLGLSTNHHWLKIQTADGRVGWVSAAYVKLLNGHFRNLPAVQ